MSNKKDASTSTKRASDETTSTDSDSYHTAQGSAQNIEELAPLPWRSGAKTSTVPPSADKPPTPTPPPPSTPSTPPPPPPKPSMSQSDADRPQASVFSNRSAVSYNPSVFGEGPSPAFDEDIRRGTVAWPQSGCIYVPLNPTNIMSNESLFSDSDGGSQNRLKND